MKPPLDIGIDVAGMMWLKGNIVRLAQIAERVRKAITARDAEWQARLDALTAEVGEWAERAALAERRGYERGLRAAANALGETGYDRASDAYKRVRALVEDAIEALIGKPEGT